MQIKTGMDLGIEWPVTAIRLSLQITCSDMNYRG